MTNAVLVVTGLSKRFGSGPDAVQANDAVDLTVRAGQVVCLLGHNGAGKSTLVNQVVGLTLPDSGTVTLDGVDAVANPARARALASVQAQANVPITGLTPRKAVELVGRIRGLDKATARRRADELLTALDLEPWADKTAEKVSGGVARLTAFAMAAVAPGRLVVLDEPTNDVDPVRRRLLWQEIRRIADAGAGILLVTHNVHEAEHVVDDVVLLDNGRVVAHGTPKALLAQHGNASLEDLYIHLVGHEQSPAEAMAA
jgi:ABC-2 type transport system ATP-binding protein